MAALLKLLAADDLFSNQREVEKAVAERHALVSGLLGQLLDRVEVHKSQLRSLVPPEQISSVKPSPKIDLATSSRGMILVKNEVVTVKTEPQWTYYPVFLQAPLADGESFQVEVVDAAWRWFAVGVATAELRNSPGKFSTGNSLCVDAYSGSLCSEGQQQQQLSRSLDTGARLTVRNSGGSIVWLLNNELLCSAAVPSHLIGKSLFPACWICSYSDAKKITRLRFLS